MLRSLSWSLALLLVAGSATAQGTMVSQGVAPPQGARGTPADSNASAPPGTTARGPMSDAATAGIHAPRTAAPPAPKAPESWTKAEKLMIIGGATMAVGLVVASGSSDQAGAIITIAGAVIFIIGLVRYLQ